MIPKKIPILFVVAVLFLSGVSGPVSGYTMSESTYQLVSDCYTDVIAGYGNVPIYGRDGTVISTGVIADIPDEKGMWDWRYETKQIVNDTRSDMKAYYFPQGPIILYGSDLLGTICVGIWKEADTVKKTRDDIYAIIDAEAKNRGIENIPVIFMATSIPDCRPLPWTDPNETPVIRPLHEIANGYPDVTAPAKNQQVYGMDPTAKRPLSGITHASVSSLIEFVSTEYGY
ncbi:hypothetical protein [Methanogenium cariaci]|jgi:hypothetical protein